MKAQLPRALSFCGNSRGKLGGSPLHWWDGQSQRQWPDPKLLAEVKSSPWPDSGESLGCLQVCILVQTKDQSGSCRLV